MPDESRPDDLHALLRELDARIRALEALPHPEIQQQIFTVLQLVDGLHRTSVARLAEILKGTDLWERLLEDEAIHILFSLYDQLPLDDLARAEDALHAVRPYIHSHGGELRVLAVEDGVVHVMLAGSCQGCSASSATLTHGVETALREGFAGFRQMVVHDAEQKPHEGWVELPMAPGQASRPQGPVFREIARFSLLPVGHATVQQIEGRAVLLIRSGGAVYAYDAACSGCGMTLEGAKITGDVLVCPWTNCAFDVRNGRRVDGEAGEALRVYPVSLQGDRVLLAIDFSPTSLFRSEA